MRPRHYAGESTVDERRHQRIFAGFNEAPALRRGKDEILRARQAPRARFNEAPALRRGKEFSDGSAIVELSLQ